MFRRDGSTGRLTYDQSYRDGTDGVDGLYRSFGLAVSPLGTHVYSVSAYENALAVFDRECGMPGGAHVAYPAADESVAGFDFGNAAGSVQVPGTTGSA